MVITEYGIAFLRGKTDAEVVASLIEIADSRFQDQLIRHAQTSGKLHAGYRLPDFARNNTPAVIEQRIAAYRKNFGLFEAYPFGSDFTEVEIRLTKALRVLKTASPLERLRLLGKGLWPHPEPFHEELARMGLDRPVSFKESIEARLLRGALRGEFMT